VKIVCFTKTSHALSRLWKKQTISTAIWASIFQVIHLE